MKSIILNNTTYDLERSKKKLTTILPSWEQDIFLFLVEWFSNSDVIEVRTSGSTGVPKKIKRPKTSMINSAKMTGSFLALQHNDSALLCLPAKYIAGKMMLVRAIVWNLQLDYIQPTNTFPRLDTDYQFGAMTPSQANANLFQLHLIQNLIIGGAPIPFDLEKKLSMIPSSSIYSSYGMTETVSHIALRIIKKPINSEYIILPHVSISNNDQDCLIIHAPQLLNESITTNDIVQITSPRSFIWKGRFDNVINSGGIKISPENLEHKLSSYISSAFFISGLNDSKWGTKVALIIEGEPFDLDDLKSIMERDFEKYQIPKQVLFLPQFIYTPNGKLNRGKTLEVHDIQ